MTNQSEEAESDPDETYDSDPVARAAEILEYGSAVWLEIAGRWYERAKTKSRWSAADVVGDCTDLVEHLTPLAERTIDLTIEALRPYAQSVRAGAGPDRPGPQGQERER